MSPPAARSGRTFNPLATARHEYYDHYNEIRESLPKVVGTRPTRSRTRC